MQIWFSGVLSSILLAALTFATSLHAASNQEGTEALYVAQHLDVLSFPNSIHPRKRPGAKMLVDYGFNHFKLLKGGVESVEDDGQWFFSVKVVNDDGSRKVLCIVDQAMNGGSYLSQGTVEVRLGADGLFHGTGNSPKSDQCPEYRR